MLKARVLVANYEKVIARLLQILDLILGERSVLEATNHPAPTPPAPTSTPAYTLSHPYVFL